MGSILVDSWTTVEHSERLLDQESLTILVLLISSPLDYADKIGDLPIRGVIGVLPQIYAASYQRCGVAAGVQSGVYRIPNAPTCHGKAREGTASPPQNAFFKSMLASGCWTLVSGPNCAEYHEYWLIDLFAKWSVKYFEILNRFCEILWIYLKCVRAA